MAGASLAIGAATAYAKAKQGETEYGVARQDSAAQEAANRQTAINAEASRNLEWNQTSIRQEQEIQSASQALMDNAVRAKRAAATGLTSAADAGVEGVSVESVAHQVYREQGRLDAATNKNLDMTIDALQDEKTQAEAKRVGRSTFSPVKQPIKPNTLVNLGLDIGGAAVNAYSLYDRKNRTGGKDR